MCERLHDDVIRACGSQQLSAAWMQRQHGFCRGADHGTRVRIEGEYRGREVVLFGKLRRPAQKRLVSEVYAVVVPRRDHGGAGWGRRYIAAGRWVDLLCHCGGDYGARTGVVNGVAWWRVVRGLVSWPPRSVCLATTAAIRAVDRDGPGQASL